MICPICKEMLVILEVQGVELDMCHDGHGMWFDRDELRQLFLGTAAPENLLELEERLERLPHREKGVKPRKCPRCMRKMWHVAQPGDGERIILDACPEGDGLWFDQGELEAILETNFSGTDDELAAIKDHLGLFTRPKERAD